MGWGEALSLQKPSKACAVVGRGEESLLRAMGEPGSEFRLLLILIVGMKKNRKQKKNSILAAPKMSRLM